mmetsp:Transcript_2690/g.10513  ORF Transcript_2690/g.10513 Transcript_2690/m.10513 type:complete len:688 (+) Transcript_2690:177-2240(+)
MKEQLRNKSRGADVSTRRPGRKGSATVKVSAAHSAAMEAQELKVKLPNWLSMPNAGVASCLAVIGTNPMDRAKTLTQLPGNKYGKDMVDALRLVCKQEGLLPGLYRGLPVAMIRESSKNMFRIGLFAPILKAMHRDENTPAPAWKRFLAGTVTGALGAVSSNPFDLVKTRMQVPAALSEYTGMGQAMRMIVRREGFGTFYKGVGASVTRDMLGSSVNLTVASMASEALINAGWFAPGSPALGAIAGILSAAAAVAVMQPIDTSRAYVYLKPHLHKNVLHAARFIVLREGPTALYRGSRAHFFRTAPHYALMFALLEGITGVERACIVRRNAETLARVPVFANLSATQRDVLARGVSVVKYARGDVIVREGDAGDDNEMFFVLRGTARSVRGGVDELDAFVESVKEGGDEKAGGRASNVASSSSSSSSTRQRPGSAARIDDAVSASAGTRAASVEADGWAQSPSGAHFGAGDYFGEQALLVDEPRAASVVATSASASCLVVNRVAFELATTGTASSVNVAHSRSKATNEIESGWRRQRFRRELASVPLLAELDERERATLAARCARVTFQPGAKIMRQGDEGDKFYILLKGSAVALKRDGRGDADKGGDRDNRVYRSYGPGAHFGELALLTNKPRSATVVARERVVALVLDKNALVELRSTVPSLEDHIVRGMRHYDHIEMFTSMAMA